MRETGLDDLHDSRPRCGIDGAYNGCNPCQLIDVSFTGKKWLESEHLGENAPTRPNIA
jgi:hypothetical protein